MLLVMIEGRGKKETIGHLQLKTAKSLINTRFLRFNIEILLVISGDLAKYFPLSICGMSVGCLWDLYMFHK
jgi:hypothetical protein